LVFSNQNTGDFAAEGAHIYFGYAVFGYAFHFWLRKIKFWLRFGYGVCFLVTFWLRFEFGYALVTLWLRFGYIFGYVFGYVRFWLRFWFTYDLCYDFRCVLVTTPQFWLRFGYVFCILVTFWLRNVAFWLRFGYASARPGKILVTHDLVTFWLRKYQIAETVAFFSISNQNLVTRTPPQHNCIVTKKFGYVY